MSLLWCQGMFASGSTWLYNVALAVAAELDPPLPVEGRFVFDARDLHGLAAPGQRAVVKAHMAEGLVADAAAHAEAVIVTLRDPRDAVVSLMQYQGFSFPRALLNVMLAAEACLRLARLPQAVTLHYERGFVDDPATIDGIAGHMGGRIGREKRDEIFALTRRANVEAFIAGLEAKPSAIRDAEGDVYDLATHWHRHHAGRTGERGRWRRRLYPAQVAGIETHLGGWMELFGYVRSDRCIDPGRGWGS